MKHLSETVVDLIWRGVDDLLRREYELNYGTAETQSGIVHGKYFTVTPLPPTPRAFLPALFLCSGEQEKRARLVRMKGSVRSH